MPRVPEHADVLVAYLPRPTPARRSVGARRRRSTAPSLRSPGVCDRKERGRTSKATRTGTQAIGVRPETGANVTTAPMATPSTAPAKPAPFGATRSAATAPAARGRDACRVSRLKPSGCVRGGVVVNPCCRVAPDVLAAGDVAVMAASELVPPTAPTPSSRPAPRSARSCTATSPRPTSRPGTAGPSSSASTSSWSGALGPSGQPDVLDGSLDDGDALLAWPDAAAPRTVVAVNHRTPAGASQAPPPAGGRGVIGGLRPVVLHAGTRRSTLRNSRRREYRRDVTTVSAFGALASIMGTSMAAAPLLQLRRIRRRHSADDVSKAFIAVVCCGSASWLAYGIALGDPFMIVPNVIGVAANGATLLVAYKLTRRPRTHVARPPGRPHRVI